MTAIPRERWRRRPGNPPVVSIDCPDCGFLIEAVASRVSMQGEVHEACPHYGCDFGGAMKLERWPGAELGA